MQEYLTYFLAESIIRRVGTDAKLSAKLANQTVIKNVHPFTAVPPGLDDTSGETQLGIRYNQVRIELQDCTQAVTFTAGPIRRIETKQTRR